MVRFPHKVRRPFALPYGSGVFSISQRVGPGSTLVGEDVDTTPDWIKTFQFRGNIRGSWFIDSTNAGTDKYGVVAEGTFPASPGTWTSRSFEFASRRARGRIRLSGVGSVSMTYGGIRPFF